MQRRLEREQAEASASASFNVFSPSASAAPSELKAVRLDSTESSLPSPRRNKGKQAGKIGPR
jgi:hypothetical protein